MSELLAKMEISASAIEANYKALSNIARTSQIAGVVKADGYGLGAVNAVQVLAKAGCKLFFVASLDEALALNDIYKDSLSNSITISVLSGVIGNDVGYYTDNHFVPVLNTLEQILSWAELGRGQPAFVHIDTGMNRTGIGFEDLLEKTESFLLALKQIKCMGVLSHLACADNRSHPMNKAQLKKFEYVQKLFNNQYACSLAASGGVFLGEEYHFDFARCGIALYGGLPNDCAKNVIQPVVKLYARIIQIRECGQGQSVGYGAGYGVQTKQKIATIACGYNDGISRRLSTNASFAFQGRALPVVGRVSMDYITVRLLDDMVAKQGDYVEVAGVTKSLQSLAEDLGTIDYETLCTLGTRWKRIWVE